MTHSDGIVDPEFAAVRAAFAEYGIKVGLAVPFNRPQHDGMPGEDELAELDAIEEAIVSGLEGHAVLVAVLTTNGMREFVAYTGDAQWLPSFDTSLQASITTHEVQVDARTDPAWTAYRSFIK